MKIFRVHSKSTEVVLSVNLWLDRTLQNQFHVRSKYNKAPRVFYRFYWPLNDQCASVTVRCQWVN